MMGPKMQFETITFNDGTSVIIKINGQKASKRTRNRVKEAGPEFLLIKTAYFDRFKTYSALVRSPKGFFGWLPLNEIVITNKKGD